MIRTPVYIRSRIVLDLASQIIGENGWLHKQALVSLRPQGGGQEPVVLSGSDSYESIWQVASGQVHMAMVNPASPLAMAHRGIGPFKEPLPVRTIAVLPSYDAMAFAVAERTGIASLADIKERRYPLRLSLRSQRDHSTHLFVQEVLRHVGFTLEDIVSWGGEVRYDPGLPGGLETPGPTPQASRLDLVRQGQVNAIFDEGVAAWIPQALDAGMRVLSLEEPLLRALEGLGFRRHVMQKGRWPQLIYDVHTLDYSGWPIYTRADLPDELVTAICAGLDQTVGRIPAPRRAGHDGMLGMPEMCRDSAAAPMVVPFHPAAERYWRERGYLG